MNETNYKIETGIDLPQNSSGRHRKYPFGDMNVGDSFVFAAADLEKLRSATSYYGSRIQKKFSIRKIVGGYRCWRVE